MENVKYVQSFQKPTHYYRKLIGHALKFNELATKRVVHVFFLENPVAEKASGEYLNEIIKAFKVPTIQPLKLSGQATPGIAFALFPNENLDLVQPCRKSGSNVDTASQKYTA